jgi:hypothetical protein
MRSSFVGNASLRWPSLHKDSRHDRARAGVIDHLQSVYDADSTPPAIAGDARRIGELSTESVNNSESVWITPTFNHIVRRVA